MPLHEISQGASDIELGYTQFTAQVDCTATTEGSATTIVTAPAIAFDGSYVCLIEFFCPTWTGTNAVNVFVSLYEDGSSLTRAMWQGTGSTGLAPGSVYGMRRFVPTTGTHTYSARGYLGSAGTFSLFAGAGGSGNYMPGFIRLSKVAV